ncbi:YjcZ family sporulation protein [Sporolactobacillus kofuensis]|uniref:YjcZ family sporulation protein n=2 Tax=Sporolactobacillus TaxID=2077 RepID=A0ABW1WBS5_9BACL
MEDKSLQCRTWTRYQIIPPCEPPSCIPYTQCIKNNGMFLSKNVRMLNQLGKRSHKIWKNRGGWSMFILIVVMFILLVIVGLFY